MGARQPFSRGFVRAEAQADRRRQVGYVRASGDGDEVRAISEELKAEAKSKAAAGRLDALREFLRAGLAAAAARRASIRPPTLDDLPEALRAGPPPDHADFQLDRPPLLKALLPILGHHQPNASSPEERAFHQAQANWEEGKRREQQALEALREAYCARQAARSRASGQLAQGDAAVLARALKEDITALALPFALPDDPTVGLELKQRAALIELAAPTLADIVPKIGRYRYVKRRDSVVREALSDDERQLIYRQILAQLALLGLDAGFHAAPAAVVDRIALVLHAKSTDPATGRAARIDLLRLEAERAAFEALDLTRVDPIACVERLGGHPNAIGQAFGG